MGPFCEVCGKDRYLIGHHINGKIRGKDICCNGERGVIDRIIDFFYNWRSCQLRCVNCEDALHANYPGGNNSRTKKIQEVNNWLIEQALVEKESEQFDLSYSA